MPEMLGSIVPGPFDFAGHYGPPNETVAPEHLALCVIYDEDGRAVFGSYVVYPSTDRHGPSRSFVLVRQGQSAKEALAAPEFHRSLMHAVR